MKKKTILVVELAMLLGIVMSAFTVPRSTPLLTFLIISGAVFVLGNVLLFKKTKETSFEGDLHKLRRSSRFYRVLALLALYWLWCFLTRTI